MFAIIKTGGKQYVVQPEEKIRIEKLDSPEGATVMFDQVLLIADGKETIIGHPTVEGARVEGKVVKHGREEKVVVFKYKAKKRYRKKKGHRQPFVEVKIDNIKKPGADSKRAATGEKTKAKKEKTPAKKA